MFYLLGQHNIQNNMLINGKSCCLFVPVKEVKWVLHTWQIGNTKHTETTKKGIVQLDTICPLSSLLSRTHLPGRLTPASDPTNRNNGQNNYIT